MTDIETALAEALHAKGGYMVRCDEVSRGADCEGCSRGAAAIFATEPMAAIARQAAIGAAVEAQGLRITAKDIREALHALGNPGNRAEAYVFAAATAIAAALEDDR